MFGAFGVLFTLMCLGLAVLTVAGLWMVFTKAGKPGWATIVPIYNMIVMLEIAGRPLWWILLFFIPLVNIVIAIIVTADLAKSFGKDVAYAVGMILLPIVFYPMLGFGSSTYNGPVAAAG